MRSGHDGNHSRRDRSRGGNNSLVRLYYRREVERARTDAGPGEQRKVTSHERLDRNVRARRHANNGGPATKLNSSWMSTTPTKKSV